MIVVNDVFIYLGDLVSIICAATHALCPGGKLVFSVESGAPGSDFTLGAHGRYSHGKGYVENCVEQAGLQISKVQDTDLRHEFGKAINAFLILATKAK